MAFFVLVKGNINKFNFPYLKGSSSPRLADTLIHGADSSKDCKADIRGTKQKETFAIEVMSKKLVLLSPADTVRAAKDIFNFKNIHHIPLEVDNRIVGIISEKDLDQAPAKRRLVDFMQRTLLCASESTTLTDIALVFMHENIHSLPIVDDNFKVTGIVTDSDLYRWLIENDKFKKAV